MTRFLGYTVGRCIYCGVGVTGVAVTCRWHRDLPALDPMLAREVTSRLQAPRAGGGNPAEAAPTISPRGSRNGS